MKLRSRIGWLLCILTWAVMVVHVPEAPRTAQVNSSLQTASCTQGQGCILVRDWTRPWMADLQDRPTRHTESKEQDSHSKSLFRSLARTDTLFPWQPTTEVRDPTLAEATLALLYPYHELG